jgi:hypothetical protein
MAYRTGIANGYLDLLLMLKRFIESSKQISAITYNPLNTGNGYVSAEGADDSAGDETWTIDFTSATEFTVTGSVSGLQTATGTVGTEYSSDGSEITFTIIAGTTAWDTGDEITFAVEDGLNTLKWTVDEYDTSDEVGAEAGNKQLIMHGPGAGGNDAIYVGIQTYSSIASDYFNWRLQGYTDYNSGVEFSNQPGSIPAVVTIEPKLYLSDRNIEYWVVANGRRIILTANVENIYESCYLGFILPYGFPNEFPYPLAIGGCGGVTSSRYSTEAAEHRAFFDPYSTTSGNNASLILWFGGWRPFGNFSALTSYITERSVGHVFPFHCSDQNASTVAGYTEPNKWVLNIGPNIDGTYPTAPLILWQLLPEKNMYGEFDGLLWICGDGLYTKDTFVLGGKNYLVISDTYRKGLHNYVALKLE